MEEWEFIMLEAEQIAGRKIEAEWSTFPIPGGVFHVVRWEGIEARGASRRNAAFFLREKIEWLQVPEHPGIEKAAALHRLRRDRV